MHQSKVKFTDWSDFECEEYVQRNYFREILIEDQSIIKRCIERLEQLASAITIDNYIDIGAGPNLYPSLLVTPWVQAKGNIFLADYAASNLAYLRKSLDRRARSIVLNDWRQFEHFMVEVGGAPYQGVIGRLCDRAKVQFGDVFKMSTNQYDCVSAFFVAESITDDRAQFQRATNTLIQSIRSGGIFVIAHMLGSIGWHAGLSTKFPAVNLSVAEIKEAYAEQKSVSLDYFSHGSQTGARHGYDGMVLVIGQKC
jgi:hypothetical protein